MDILLGVDGDLDLSNGGLATCTNGSEAAQRIGLAIDLNLGEFFTHANYGLPWIENPDESFSDNVRYFLGTDFSSPASYIATTLDKYILSLDLVDTLDSDYSFDTITREFSYTFTVETTEGETIEFPPYLQQIY